MSIWVSVYSRKRIRTLKPADLVAGEALVKGGRQLLGRKVIKMDLVGEAAVEPGVGLQKLGHLVGVPRQNDHQVSVSRFRCQLDDLVKDLPPLLVITEPVGLVDEEDAAQGLVEGVARLFGKLALVLADKGVVTNLDKTV